MAKKSVTAKNSAKKRKTARKNLYKWAVRIAIIVMVLVFLAFMIFPMFVGPKAI